MADSTLKLNTTKGLHKQPQPDPFSCVAGGSVLADEAAVGVELDAGDRGAGVGRGGGSQGQIRRGVVGQVSLGEVRLTVGAAWASDTTD